MTVVNSDARVRRESNGSELVCISCTTPTLSPLLPDCPVSVTALLFHSSSVVTLSIPDYIPRVEEGMGMVDVRSSPSGALFDAEPRSGCLAGDGRKKKG